jgi:hypothetical protein
MTIYSNNKVKPWLERQLWVLVAEDLKAEGVVVWSVSRLLTGFTVKSANESI